MSARLREVTLHFLAEPEHANHAGKVNGGIVVRWIGQAGQACAVEWSGKNCVTVYLGGIRFYKPIHIGNEVEVCAQVIYTGKTSMHLAVDVFAKDNDSGSKTKATHCIIIFVALDDMGSPVPIQRWEPQNEQENTLEQYAKRLMDLRKAIETEMSTYLA